MDTDGFSEATAFFEILSDEIGKVVSSTSSRLRTREERDEVLIILSVVSRCIAKTIAVMHEARNEAHAHR